MISELIVAFTNCSFRKTCEYQCNEKPCQTANLERLKLKTERTSRGK